MSTEPRRGHVPALALGRYRTLVRAARNAENAAIELHGLGAIYTAEDFRRGAQQLRSAAHRLRVELDANGKPKR